MAPPNLRIAAAIILFQLLCGTAVMLNPGSWQGYAPVVAVPVVIALLPGSGLVLLLLNIINDQLVHYAGLTPGFPTPIWVPAVLVIGGIVLLAALSAFNGRLSGSAHWALGVAELSCVLSPLGPLFMWQGFPPALLTPAVVPLIALGFLIAARDSRHQAKPSLRQPFE